MRTLAVIGLSLLLCSRVVALSPAPPALLTDADIDRIITDRIDVQHQGVGIVVGVIDANGRRIISHGRMDTPAGAPAVDGDTVFEIGSATKLFTSLLLANAVERGEVALTDPASKYLPSGVTMPGRGSQPITLAQACSASC